MKQGVMTQITGMMKGGAVLQKCRTGNRKAGRRQQRINAQTLRSLVTPADIDIDIFRGKVSGPDRSGNMQFDCRVGIVKRSEARHQPPCGKSRRGANRKRPTRIAVANARGGSRHPVENIGEFGEIVRALLGQRNAPGLPVKELDAEIFLKRLDLVADCRLCDAELFCRVFESTMPRRGFEGAHSREGR